LGALLANSLLLAVIYFAVRTLAHGDILVALPVTIATALSPVLLGVTRLAGSDAPLWSFGAAATFSFLAFLETGRRRFLGAAALFTGCALLSRPAAVVLFPFFLVALIGKFAFHRGAMQTDESDVLYLRRALGSLAAVIIGSLAVFLAVHSFVPMEPLVFWDATVGFLRDWNLLTPLTFIFGLSFIDAFLLKGRFSTRLATTITPFLGETRVLLIPFALSIAALFTAPGTGWLSGFRTLLISTPPLMFGLMLLCLVQALRTRQHPYRFEILFFATLITVSLFAITRSAVTPDIRSLCALVPFVSFLSGLGLRELVLLIPETSRARLFPYVPPLIIVLGALTLLRTLPHPLDYVSPLFLR
jgi:hypothetical protein